MMTHAERIEQANRAVARAGANVQQEVWRPRYHFTAPAGWLNDPNGLIYAKGLYHLFYQFNPYSNEWGSMHWGHAVSSDLTNWEHRPVALAPSEPYDDEPTGGCFSGSAVEAEDGTLFLIYTATARHAEATVQTQCLALSKDGVNFEKYAGNPVISEYPDGISKADARDPKVFRHDERWYLVLGASVGGSDNGEGKVLLYCSDDLFRWEFISVLYSEKERCGTMCECPDFFPIGDKWVLTFSPMKAEGSPTAVYVSGTMDFDTGCFAAETSGELDLGPDYYAPQSMLDEDGNRVLIAWQNGWSWMPWWRSFGPTDVENWRGCMSLPRNVSLREDGKLRLAPVRQLERLRYAPVFYEAVAVDERPMQLSLVDGTSFEWQLEASTDDISSALELRIRDNGTNYATIQIDLRKKQLTLDASRCDPFSTATRSCPLELPGNRLTLDIWIDRSSVEIFADNGAICLTCNLYPSEDQTGVSIRTMGGNGIVNKMSLYSLRAAGGEVIV